MTDLLAARSQMAVSLAFHIIFACIGIAMPFFMAVAHWKWLRTRRQVYLDLTKAWSKGVAIFFATGAVSGTVLSFELGLLWPEFMKHAGAIIGLPFSWEGTAFFIEAIALGIFLYGWDRVPEKVHWLCGLVVGLSGVASAFFVIAANGWMNSPTGFDWVNGEAINIDPVAAMFNDAFLGQSVHMVIAAFSAVGFAVAGVHALLLLRQPQHEFHQKAFAIAMTFASLAAIAQPLSGDLLAKDVAQRQPLKLAAMEAHFATEKGAPLIIGGIPNVAAEKVDFALRLPKMLSFLAYGDFNAEVKGLKDFPRDLWPPVLITHLAFQSMVGIGFLQMSLGFVYLFLRLVKRRGFFHRRLLQVVAFATPLGFVAVECGWVVTEVGRQPWVIYGIMKTKDALTPMPGLIFPFLLFTALYAFLSFMVGWLLVRQIKAVKGY